jgi:hypothetical protein
MSLRVRGALCAALLVAAGIGCGGDSTGPSRLSPAALTAVSGSGQSGTLGSLLPTPLVVSVTSSSGSPVSGATVTFAVTSGSATVSPTSAQTDAQGKATAQVTLGSTAGNGQVTASVSGTSLTTTFTFTASPPVDASCSSGAISPAIGSVTPAISGSRVCLSGGSSGAEYVVVPANASPDASASASLTLQGTNVSAVTGSFSIASASITPSSIAPLGISLARQQELVSLSDSFQRTLRTLERTELTRIAGARRWRASRQNPTGLSLNMIPSSVTEGQLLQLNANGTNACTVPISRTGRVVAVTNRAIIVADTGNPSGGYTDAEYRSIGVTFDTLVDPLDRAAFGDPSDIDNNSHVVLFFTRQVNSLTPRNSNGAFVGGFFFARDLFPNTATPDFDACTTSNVGEMFYLMVPDPTGLVNGNVFTKAQVLRIARSTVAHEYQHLINAARRMFVNTSATDFEDVWLNEGLSHEAEELLFFREAGLSPRQNIDVTAIRRSSSIVDAFNADAAGNFGRFGDFLEKPSQNSPYADNDSLATRGAIWSFLRYAVDRTATSDGTLWKQLVNSTTTGMGTLQVAFGSSLPTLFNDWRLSLVADDLGGAPATYQQQSWNFRSIYAALQNSTGYPLQATALATATPATVSLAGGGAAFVRFSVGANQTGTVDWGSTPPNVSVALVRTK